jgi:hypothetical protein
MELAAQKTCAASSARDNEKKASRFIRTSVPAAFGEGRALVAYIMGRMCREEASGRRL